MELRLPNLGEGADSGVVVSVLVKEGDVIQKGQTILELENEKAVAPIPASAAGTVSKISIKEGDKISVGQLLLVLEGGAAKPSSKPGNDSPAQTAKPRKPRNPEPQLEVEVDDDDEASDEPDFDENWEPAAAPSIRRLARDIGLDLRKIKGSERGGRIVLEDIQRYIKRLEKLASQKNGKAAPAATPAAPPKVSIDFSQWGPVKKQSMTPLRKVIARRMQENWNVIPHVTQFDEPDITQLMALRKKYNDAYKAQNTHLTLTTLTLKILVATLKKHPLLNASIDEVTEEIVFKDYYHIGIAVDTDAGLIVPVIKDVDKKSLVQLGQELSSIAEKARTRSVAADDLKGGSFTISNQGGIGGSHFTPIVNKPEVAILGMGRGAVKPVYIDGQIQPRTLLPITLSYDHRIIDGGNAARFMQDLVTAFQTFPESDIKI